MKKTDCKTVELKRADSVNARGQFRWFVRPTDDHIPCFSPQQSGDQALQACLTWLKTNGYESTDDVMALYQKAS